ISCSSWSSCRSGVPTIVSGVARARRVGDGAQVGAQADPPPIAWPFTAPRPRGTGANPAPSSEVPMPSSPLVIAVDSSTTSTKAIIVDAAGRVLAQHRCELAMHTPQVHCYEQDPRDWWHSTDRAIAGAVAA